MSADKDTARKAAFARRKAAHGQGLDGKAQAQLRDALVPYQGRSLAGYMAMRTEIDPLPVMAGWDGAVCVPVIRGKSLPLVFHRWTADTAMVEGPFGARVPARAEAVVPEVLIVPLVAFSKDGFRLGYGGGFYDRTLEGLRANRPTIAVGFAYSAQRDDALPVEPTDQPLDLLVTETGVLRFGGA